MLTVISPAKTLDFESKPATPRFTQPQFLDHSQELIEQLREFSPAQISELMHVSDKIGGLNAARFGSWTPAFTPENAKQAIYMFNGDVYEGIDPHTLHPQHIHYLQQHVRLLSGLYGLLRPLDLMQAYRLEMGTPFANSRGKNLYEFWGDRLTTLLNHTLQQQASTTLINLASQEYYKALHPQAIHANIITPVFKDQKNGQYKIISFYAKRARGLMVRYAAQHQISQPEQLKHFDYEGYAYNEAASSDNEWVFLRQENKK